MKKIYVSLLTIFLLFGLVAAASATLIGDTVTLNHVHSGNSGNDPYFIGDITVTDDSSDLAWFYSTYSVNVQADQILINTCNSPSLTTWSNAYTTGGMNGLVVTDIDDSSGNFLSGFTVDTNYLNWNDDRVFFDNNSISFDWQNLQWGPDIGYDSAYFYVTLEFDSAPVPEPATFILLGSGLAGLAFYRRKRK